MLKIEGILESKYPLNFACMVTGGLNETSVIKLLEIYEGIIDRMIMQTFHDHFTILMCKLAVVI